MLLRAALALASRGLRIFPCRARDKRPATPNGLKDATTDLVKIESWWLREPDSNIGIATGAASGIFVVDVDGSDGEAALRALERELGPLPPTVESITGRGRHIYFRWSPEHPVRSTTGKIAAHVDSRGQGGYVLSPPSIHPSGRKYCWSVDSAHSFADAPAWLLARARDGFGDNGVGYGTAAPPKEWRALVKGVAEGARNASAARLAGHLLRRHIDPLVSLELIQAWNAARCSPPLPATEIESIVASIAAKELKRRGGNGG